MNVKPSHVPRAWAWALACASLAPGLHAASILFVSDNGPKGTQVGSDGITRGAFHPPASANGTPYVDQAFVDLLVAAGHTVARYNPASTVMSLDDVPLINSYDLVVAGSALNSGPFNLNARGAKWNTMITAPMIYTKSTLVRRDRTGFLLDNKEFDCAADASTTASGKWTLVEPAHPIFSGIARSNVGGKDVMDGFANVRVATPSNNRGTSIQYFRLSIGGVDQGIANDVEAGGRILATIDFNPLDPGVNIPAGQAPAANPSYIATGYAVVEWPAGSVVRTTQVPDGSETLAGYRLLFACGTRDASGSVTASPNPQAGALDLSADGQRMFLNAVNHALGKSTANAWANTSGDFSWAGANWTNPTTWADDGDALFQEAGVGTVLVGSPTVVHKLDFRVPGYVVQGNGGTLQLGGDAAGAVASVRAPATLAASLVGEQRLVVVGTSQLTLAGDAGAGVANAFTGGTYVRGGTVILKAAGGATSGDSFALGNIEAIDAGATVRIGTENDGTTNVRPADGQVLRTATTGRLRLTGGTFDNHGDDNGLQYPPPEGSGTILNSSPYKRAVLKLQRGDGGIFVFDGQIKDGGPNTTTSQGIAYQQNVDMNGGNYTLVLGGSNAFTGFIRLNSATGNTIILTNQGTLGYPPPVNAPARHILMNSGKIDLNGTSQRVGYVFTGNDSGSVITNSAPGTVSTLTVGFNVTNLVAYNGAATPRGLRAPLLDDPSTGGVLALTKEGSGIQPLGTYPADAPANPVASNYHGDTTVNDGILQVLSLGAISPNSAFRLNTTQGVLQLDFTGIAPVKQLFVNGRELPNGVYGSETAPIAGTGKLQVTQSTFVPPPTLVVAPVAGGLRISWDQGTLESSADLAGPWSPVDGATQSPIDVSSSEGRRFYRARR